MMVSKNLKRKIAEHTEKLQVSNLRYQTLFDNIRVGIGVATFGGHSIAANATLLQMFESVEAEQNSVAVREFCKDPKEPDIFMEQLKRTWWQLLTSQSVN